MLPTVGQIRATEIARDNARKLIDNPIISSIKTDQQCQHAKIGVRATSNEKHLLTQNSRHEKEINLIKTCGRFEEI